MKDPQREVEELRTDVNCATVIERTSPSRRLDKRESTRRCLKYRRGAGEIVIVTHGAAACLQSSGSERPVRRDRASRDLGEQAREGEKESLS